MHKKIIENTLDIAPHEWWLNNRVVFIRLYRIWQIREQISVVHVDDAQFFCILNQIAVYDNFYVYVHSNGTKNTIVWIWNRFDILNNSFKPPLKNTHQINLLGVFNTKNVKIAWVTLDPPTIISTRMHFDFLVRRSSTPQNCHRPNQLRNRQNIDANILNWFEVW